MVFVEETLPLLEKEYGPHPWHPHHEPLPELILTVLSQNTSDVNSHRAFGRLQESFASWEELAEAPLEKIRTAIEPGGLAQIKARRIKEILQKIEQERGTLELDFLQDLSLPEAKAWLRKLPGVGPKTAACVLLFALGKPALPVDTHISRVARRLGLIPPKVSVEKAHDLLESLLIPEDIYPFHIYLIEHGRRICQARRPMCPQCILAQICPSSYLGFYHSPTQEKELLLASAGKNYSKY